MSKRVGNWEFDHLKEDFRKIVAAEWWHQTGLIRFRFFNFALTRWTKKKSGEQE